MGGVEFLSTHDRDLPDGSHGEGSRGHSEYLEDTTSQYNLAVTVAGLNGTHGHRRRPAPDPGRTPTRDFYSSVPDPAHGATRPARGSSRLVPDVEDGLEEAWDRAKDFRLPDPVIRVPW